MEYRKRPPKAYRNLDFLHSRDARSIRILAEYYEPLSRFQKYGIENSIVFFGSARSTDLKSAKKDIEKFRVHLEKEQLPEKEIEIRINRRLKLAEYYEDAVKLSEKLTLWTLDKKTGKQEYYICSGGGPGMMEAANKGAHKAGGKSIGLNISIPMEQYPNRYISEELMFEFHYFFIRKFWFIYLAKALVVFPGGFGTMDELMEVITLIQTQKLTRRLPIVIYGSDYWNDVLNLNALVQWGTISHKDLDLIYFADEVDTAFDYLVKNMDKE